MAMSAHATAAGWVQRWGQPRGLSASGPPPPRVPSTAVTAAEDRDTPEDLPKRGLHMD